MKLTQEQVSEATQVLTAIGNEVRLQIMVALAEAKMNVTGLCETLELPQPTVSHHLSILRLARLVTDSREGKQVVYSIHSECPKVQIGKITFGGKK